MKKLLALLLTLAMLLGLTACSAEETEELLEVAIPIAVAVLEEMEANKAAGESLVVIPPIMDEAQTELVPVEEIPEFSGDAWIAVNGNIPFFVEEEYTTEDYEFYSELDELGRCGMTMACIGIDIMPTEERGNIGSVKPSGWQSVKYDIVDGKYLYNRCHLIGFQLAGENANRRNLITGTRYLNIEGMLPFENLVADYVKETKNHVMYRVTPLFDGDNLVAHGVLMEGYSVEDNGEGVCFCVYAYNAQPGIVIDYATGNSREAG